ncbi:DegT/DnrJ/EryC1/StrS family aminotransferase [Candidatus Pelagibacter sp.]|nr:DegT/DnrJ/EryC1/StrS family aminotransferase [Candidatus Pelagibacter sp.]
MKYSLVSDSWGKEEVNAIKKVIKSGIYTYKGRFVKDFEYKFAKYFKSKFAVMVNSGSSANLIAIASLFYKKKKPLKRGDEIIVPALAWSTTYHPLQQYGLKIRLVDIDIQTLNVKVEDIIKSVTNKTKAILAVSILGNPVELQKLKKFCSKKNIYLIEDNCESMGAKINNKFTGTFGIVNTFSTFFSHHISTIEGGVLLTNNREIYEIALSLRSHGWTRDNSKSFYMKKFQSSYEDYCFILPGYNVRPNNIYAAVGIEQLKKLDKLIKIRRKNHEFFLKLFSKDKRFIIQKLKGYSSSFAFTFIFKKKYLKLKSKILNKLKKAGIEYRLITGGCFLKHPVKKYYKYSVFENLKNTNYIHENGFFVGNHPKSLVNELKYLKKTIG